MSAVAYSFEHKAMACKKHGPTPIHEPHVGRDRYGSPLQVYRCKTCGAQTNPGLHFDLGM